MALRLRGTEGLALLEGIEPIHILSHWLTLVQDSAQSRSVGHCRCLKSGLGRSLGMCMSRSLSSKDLRQRPACWAQRPFLMGHRHQGGHARCSSPTVLGHEGSSQKCRHVRRALPCSHKREAVIVQASPQWVRRPIARPGVEATLVPRPPGPALWPRETRSIPVVGGVEDIEGTPRFDRNILAPNRTGYEARLANPGEAPGAVRAAPAGPIWAAGLGPVTLVQAGELQAEDLVVNKAVRCGGALNVEGRCQGLHAALIRQRIAAAPPEGNSQLRAAPLP
mmetsp:Transcript_79214/g.175664  ORF Transcript_79214/g.175664 Transcript_79214/m.175664 type:complete len:279 (+) Transcript_79214:862-1698(+)